MSTASRNRSRAEEFQTATRRGALHAPYNHNVELPAPVRAHLPEHAQTIYREAFNHAWMQYQGDPGRRLGDQRVRR